jgi:hypothetical protein
VPEKKRDFPDFSGVNRPYQAITVKVKFGGTASGLLEHCLFASRGKKGVHCLGGFEPPFHPWLNGS